MKFQLSDLDSLYADKGGIAYGCKFDGTCGHDHHRASKADRNAGKAGAETAMAHPPITGGSGEVEFNPVGAIPISQPPAFHSLQ